MQTAIELQEKVEYLESALEHKNNYILQLEEWIKQQRQKTFGSSSEKRSPDQLGLFNEVEELNQPVADDSSESTTVATHIRQKKPRVSIPDDLPREDIIYDVAGTEKHCPHDGTELKVIGSDDHEQLDIIPAQIKVLRHRRLKYACPCCDQHIVTAKKPNQPIEKSIASAGLLAFIATQKYCDALPLYRQTEIFKRIGIELNRTNLANWMVKMGELVQPLLDHFTAHLQKQNVLHMDETTLQVLDEPGKAA